MAPSPSSLPTAPWQSRSIGRAVRAVCLRAVRVFVAMGDAAAGEGKGKARSGSSGKRAGARSRRRRGEGGRSRSRGRRDRGASTAATGVASIPKDKVDRLAKRLALAEIKIRDLRSAFASAAVNGSIDVFGFKEAFGVIGHVNPGVVHALFKSMDQNGNGLLDEPEFVLGMSALIYGTVEEKLQLAFDVYDTDGSKSISRIEMRRALMHQVATGERLLLTMYHLDRLIGAGDGEDVTPELMAAAAASVKDSDLVMSASLVDELVAQAFARWDKNNDDTLSLDEWMQWGAKVPAIGDVLKAMSGQSTLLVEAADDADHGA